MRQYNFCTNFCILCLPFPERLITAQGEVEGVRSFVDELYGEKASIQHRYDKLSAAVDARVDQLEVQSFINRVYLYSFNLLTYIHRSVGFSVCVCVCVCVMCSLWGHK